MEFVVLLALVAAAALFVGWPRAGDEAPEVEAGSLREERERLLAEWRALGDSAEVDEDARSRRRELGVRVREVTEALRALGES